MPKMSALKLFTVSTQLIIPNYPILDSVPFAALFDNWHIRIGLQTHMIIDTYFGKVE